MINIILLIFGAMCLYIGISGLRIHSRNQKRDFAAVQGTVVEVAEQDSKKGKVTVQVLEYVIDGQTFTAECQIKRSDLTVGSTIDLLVDKDDHDYLLINDKSQNVPLISGVVLVVVGGIMSALALLVL